MIPTNSRCKEILFILYFYSGEKNFFFNFELFQLEKRTIERHNIQISPTYEYALLIIIIMRENDRCLLILQIEIFAKNFCKKKKKKLLQRKMLKLLLLTKIHYYKLIKNHALDTANEI